MSKHDKRKNRQLPGSNPTGFQITAHAAHFSGPLPPPDILVRYNDAVPGGADRIMAMAEGQMRHRQSLETKVVDSNCRAQKVGSIFGFIVCMTAIVGGVFLIYAGKSAGYGLAAIISALTALAAVFIVGRIKQQAELRKKAESLATTAETSN